MMTETLHAPSRTNAGLVIAPNRRQSERYPVVEGQAWIGWWEGRLYRKSPAALVDISQGGVRLLAESAPGRRSTSWICLAGQPKTEWVEGTVLDARPLASGSFEIRLAFREVCPYAYFEVAVCGPPEMVEDAGPQGR